MKSSVIALALAVVAFGLVGTRAAFAADYYVNNACTYNGDGLADTCAGATGQRGAFLSPQSCLSVIGAGETCFIRTGSRPYIQNTNNTHAHDGGFHIDHSGAPGAPITVRNYPGETPILANCASGPPSTSCSDPTLTAFNRSYVSIQGLTIRGGISLYCDVGRCAGIEIAGNDITWGWQYCDGNWSGIFLGPGGGGIAYDGPIIHHNYIHDIDVPSGCFASSAAMIKFFEVSNAIVEYNTLKRMVYTGTSAGGIQDKERATSNTFRYNWVEDVQNGVWLNAQTSGSGDTAYGNVFIGKVGDSGTSCFKGLLETGSSAYNNTCVGFGYSGYSNASDTTASLYVYNNIFSGITSSNIFLYNATGWRFDYNAYTPGRGYMVNRANYSSLGSLRTAVGWESHGLEVDCQFVGANDFRLRTGSPCAGVGRTSGQASGAAVDLGAFGVTDCVGRTCGGGSSGPSAPSAVRIIQ